MPTTKTITLYTFDELSDKAKREARVEERVRRGKSLADSQSSMSLLRPLLNCWNLTFKHHDVGLIEWENAV